MNTKLLLCTTILFIFTFLPVYADKLAVTEDGKTVILKDNGTWIIKKEEKKFTKNQFRKTTWGMSKIQVKATESTKLEKEDNSLVVYSGNVAGMETLIFYIFADDKLVRAKYSFIEKHSNRNDYISDYNNLKETLKKKYGKAKEEKSYWRNDLYRDEYSQWGFAISLGHLIYFSQWKVQDTDIALVLSGENYRIRLAAEYSSKSLEGLEKKVREKQRESDF